MTKNKEKMIINISLGLIVLIALCFLFAPIVNISAIGNLNLIDVMFGKNGLMNDYFILPLIVLLPIISFGLTFIKTDEVKEKEINNISLVLVIITIVLSFSYAALYKGINSETVESSSFSLGWGLIVYASLTTLSLFYYLRSILESNEFTVREIPELAIFIALAVVLDFVPKIRIGATGGSISLTMVPLFIIAFRFNFVKSFLAIGVVYGIITCQLDGYGFQSYPFDYLLGFGLISLASFFRTLIFTRQGNPKIQHYLFLLLAIFVGGFGRFVGSTISSVVLYHYSFAPAAIYNLTYIGPSILLVMIILSLLLVPFTRLNRRYPIE